MGGALPHRRTPHRCAGGRSPDAHHEVPGDDQSRLYLERRAGLRTRTQRAGTPPNHRSGLTRGLKKGDPMGGRHAAIAGLGLTEVGKVYGRTAADFADEAVRLAVTDAGLKLRDVDGL